jgi:hypothetical protein
LLFIADLHCSGVRHYPDVVREHHNNVANAVVWRFTVDWEVGKVDAREDAGTPSLMAHNLVRGERLRDALINDREHTCTAFVNQLVMHEVCRHHRQSTNEHVAN